MTDWKARAARLGLIVAAACAPPPPDDPARALDPEGSGLPIAVLSRMDSAAQAYAAGDAETARGLYVMVTDSAPDLAAAWFGLYLAEHDLGRKAAADSALARARRVVRAD